MTVLHICCNLAGSTVFPQLFEALAAQGLEQVVFVPEKRAADLGKNEPRGVKTIRAMTVRQSDALFFFRKAQRSVPAIEGQIDMAGVTLIHAHTLFTDGSIAARLAKKHGLPRRRHAAIQRHRGHLEVRAAPAADGAADSRRRGAGRLSRRWRGEGEGARLVYGRGAGCAGGQAARYPQRH